MVLSLNVQLSKCVQLVRIGKLGFGVEDDEQGQRFFGLRTRCGLFTTP